MEVMSSCASKCSLHRLKNIDENTPALSEAISRAVAPETPTESMEFLARSWSVSAVELSKALSNSNPPSDNGGDTISMNILKESNLQQLPKETSPPISPRGSDEMRELFLLHQALNPDFLSHQQQLHKNGAYKSMVRKKTMRRWVREQKKHEIRTQNAQVHAAVSVAGVAAAVAALAAAAATFPEPSCRGKAQPQPGRTSAAMASAAGVVASHCIEIAEEMGAHHDHILAVVNSAVNARSNGDIMALTAAAATALRGASILKTRMQKGYGTTTRATAFGASDEKDKIEQSNTILSSLNFVSHGGDLLKRTRKGDLHWKQVSFSINSNWQVVAKMKSTYMAGTFTKKKKCVVSGVCCDVAAWPGRAVKDGSGERRTYFGIKTSDRVIEFECRNKDEKLMWTHGIQHMLNCHPNLPVF